MQRILIAVVLALSAAGASAQVHKCVDAKGKISYSETPCSAAERGGQVLGSEATEKRWEPDGYRHQLQMESLNRANQQQRELIDGPPQAPRTARSAPAPQGDAPPEREKVADTEKCETISTRQGCIGGERARNPNWSPRKGYYGGGGPADQRREEEERRLAQERAARPRPPLTLTNCNASGCWGNNGVHYNRAAGGNLVGTDGSFCVRSGNTYSCN